MKKIKNIVAVIFVLTIGTSVFFSCIEHKLACSHKEVFLPIESDTAAKIRELSTGSVFFLNPEHLINITDKPPFQKAFYRDSWALSELIGDVFTALWLQRWTPRWIPYWTRQEALSNEPMSNEEGKKAYMIISCDEEYIYSGVIKEKDSELYAKYNPITKKDKNVSSVIKTSNNCKFYRWIIREMSKESMISITGTQKVYLAKSFNKNK